MTREEAIKRLKEARNTIQPFRYVDEAIDYAIKALEQGPCENWYDVSSGEMTLEQARQAVRDLRKMWAEHLEQEPCEDCISRQAVLDGVDRYIYKSQSTGTQDDFYSFAELVVKQLPSVTPQPKTGHWIDVNKGKWNTIPAYRCSECEANADLRDWSGKSPFCPWCGAKMVESQERSD